jgi:hypothetical protein
MIKINRTMTMFVDRPQTMDFLSEATKKMLYFPLFFSSQEPKSQLSFSFHLASDVCIVSW